MPITKILENGKCLKIAPGEPKIVEKIDTGKLIVEGKNLYDAESAFIRERRKYSFEGIILISLIIHNDNSIDKKIKITFKGLPHIESEMITSEFKINFIENYIKHNQNQKSSDETVTELVKNNLRKVMKNFYMKKPDIEVHLIRY